METDTNKIPLAGIILAGGQSRRMGRDKAMLDYGNGPAVLHLARQLEAFCAEVFVVSAQHGAADFNGIRVVADESRDMGPLMGILSGLEASAHEFNFVVSCDIPYVNCQVVQLLCAAVQETGLDIAALSVAPGSIEPLFAVYRKTVRPRARALLACGERRIHALFECCKTRAIFQSDATWFVNVNTPTEYQHAKGLCNPPDTGRHFV